MQQDAVSQPFLFPPPSYPSNASRGQRRASGGSPTSGQQIASLWGNSKASIFYLPYEMLTCIVFPQNAIILFCYICRPGRNSVWKELWKALTEKFWLKYVTTIPKVLTEGQKAKFHFTLWFWQMFKNLVKADSISVVSLFGSPIVFITCIWHLG